MPAPQQHATAFHAETPGYSAAFVAIFFIGGAAGSVRKREMILRGRIFLMKTNFLVGF
jgi:hypothetical protein